MRMVIQLIKFLVFLYKWPCVLSHVLSGRRLPTASISYLFTANTIVPIFMTLTWFVSGCYLVSIYAMWTAYLVRVWDSRRGYLLSICVVIRSFNLPSTKEDGWWRTRKLWNCVWCSKLICVCHCIINLHHLLYIFTTYILYSWFGK